MKVLTTTQKALDDYIREASSKDGELELQAEEFKAVLAERDNEITALREALDEIKAEKLHVGDSFEDNVNTSVHLDDDQLSPEESKGLFDTLEARKEEIERAQSEAETERRKSIDTAHLIESRDNMIEEVNSKNKELATQLEESRKDLSDLLESHKATVSALEMRHNEETDEYRSQVAILEKQLEVCAEEVGAAVSKVAELESSAKIAEEDALSESKTRTEEMQQMNLRFQAREQELETRIDNLLAELKSTHDATIKADEGASVALQDQAAKVKALEDELKVSQQSLFDANKNASEALQKQNGKVHTLEGELKVVRDGAASALSRVESLEEELKASKVTSEEAKKNASAAQAKVDALQNDLQVSKEGHKSLATSHEEQVAKGKALEDDLQAVQSELKQAAASAQQLYNEKLLKIKEELKATQERECEVKVRARTATEES